MGNVGSSNNRRRHGGGGESGRCVHPPVTPPIQEAAANQFVHPAAATPYDHHQSTTMDPIYGRYPAPLPVPYMEHQETVTIKNNVNIKRETLRIEPDEENSGQFLVTFTFDATVSGSITVLFFAKEGDECVLTSTKENILAPVIINFQQGLGQKFRQPAGTGINFSMFEESELLKVGDVDIYPVAVKADASSGAEDGSYETPKSGNKRYTDNSQITQAVFEKGKGELRVKVVKQILWVNGMRYELQEIYGIRTLESNLDGNDPGKECVICLLEPRDTIGLPCHHVCMCSGCAKVLRFQTNRCPICKQPVETLLEFRVRPGPEPEE